jgi:hypothetical protein
MSTINSSNFLKYSCDICGIKTNNKKDYNNHITTRKHINNSNPQHFIKNETQTSPNFKCAICSKEYKSRSGIWRHEKKCINESTKTQLPTDITFLTNLVLEVVKNNTELQKQTIEFQKQNHELQKQMLEVCQTSSSNTTINNNKTFNMQFFLNEQCKDAMNIMEFVDTFQLQFSDLENVGKVGYVEGISDIIIKKLIEMDVYKRPIHCSDSKRDTLFVKDKDVWTKETGNHDKLRLAIRYITKKNTDMLNPWCESHPGSLNSENYLNDIYLNIVMQAMGGKGEMEENENKIIKKIAKMVLIDK